MKLIIKNYRAIAHAEIDLSPIALIGAPNACGKTSCAQALASTLLGTAVILDGLRAGDAGQLIKSGSDRAQIIVEGDGGAGQIKIPHGKFDSKGERPPHASRYALGIQSIVTDDARERSKVLMEYLKPVPTRDDLIAALPDLVPEYIDALWKQIEKNGFDGQHERSKEVGAKLKGQWETLSGENWGSQIAQTWVPEGWSSELASRSVESLDQALADARSTLEAGIASGAVSDEERARLEALAARAENLVSQVAQQKTEIAAADARIKETVTTLTEARSAVAAGAERARLEKLAATVPTATAACASAAAVIKETLDAIAEAEKARDALPKPGDAAPARSTQTLGVCPHCHKKVCINGATLTVPSELIPGTAGAAKAEQDRKDRTTAIAKAELNVRAKRDLYEAAAKRAASNDATLVTAQEAKAKLAAMPKAAADIPAVESLEASLTDIRSQRDEMQRNLGTLEKSLAEAQRATVTLADLPGGTMTAAEIDRLREVERLANRDLDVFKRKTEADRLAEKILLNISIIAALDPKGVRQTKLAACLGGFNASLKTICEAANWPVVELDEDLRTSIGGYRYVLASASQQWRIRAALQIAMGQIDGSEVLIFDGADILDTPGRNGLLKALVTLGKTALVTMTESKVEKVPDLRAAGFGNSYWISDGAVRPIADVTQQSAA